MRDNPNDLTPNEILHQLERARKRRKIWKRMLGNIDEWIVRARLIRQRKLRRRRQKRKDGPMKALKWAASKIGTTEDPAGSNLGPGADGITAMQRYTGYAVPPGVYWCGCFVAYAICKVGGALIPARQRLGYNGFIVEDANAGMNGLKRVSFDDAETMDIVTFTFPHIGLVVRRDGDYLETIEGNTSSGTTGSQNNGGGVYSRRRHRQEVACVARPEWT